MNSLLIAALLFISSLNSSYTKEEVRAEYAHVIKQTRPQYKESYTINFAVDTLSRSWIASFFQENRQMTDYLYANSYQVAYEYHKRMQPGGTVADIVDNPARLDTIMFERLLPIISNYLNEKGSKIEAYEPWTKPQITLDRLAGNAAKFFFPDSVQPDGRIRSHICVGLNGFKDLKDVRSVMMEAFCWSVINTKLFEENSPLMQEFDKALKFANDLQLSAEPETKLKRYQGVVWAYMSQSPVLRDMLMKEYEKKKHLLTFVVKP